MNSVAMAYFFEVICYSIFEYLLAASFKDRSLFSPISTYFGMVEINNQGMLYLYCLVWFCNAFYITQLYEQLQADSEYTAYIVEFIDCIIRYSIIPKDEAHASQSDVLLAFFDNSDSSFVLKLDINLNVVVRKCQIHLSTYNTTCYKYGIAIMVNIDLISLIQ